MSSFRIKTCTVGQIGTNCYLVYREDVKSAVVVDPGDNSAFILNKCREYGVTPKAVFLTHGHFDHILALGDVLRAFPECAVYAGREEEKLLGDVSLNLSEQFGGGVTVQIDEPVDDGDELRLAGMTWKVIFTPGHTEGSVCYYDAEDGVLLSGDTLFAESFGRTDFPTGSSEKLLDSIMKKLFVLPDGVMVYPGHGEPTSIGHEKTHNPAAFYSR